MDRKTKNISNRSDERPIKFNPAGKYNLDFIDWNNEWERASEIAVKLENGEEVSDEEEAQRVEKHMNIEKAKNGISVDLFELLNQKSIDISKECYICLKNFSKKNKIRKLPCSHMFCENCLKPWIKNNHVCPTCKFDLKPTESNCDDDKY